MVEGGGGEPTFSSKTGVLPTNPTPANKDYLRLWFKKIIRKLDLPGFWQ